MGFNFAQIINDKLNVQKNDRHELTTVYNKTVGANAVATDITVTWKGERETWILVSSDKPNWDLNKRSAVWSAAGSTSTGFYPERKGEMGLWTEQFPARSLSIMRSHPTIDSQQQYLVPTNILEAKEFLDVGDFKLQFHNKNVEIANVIIKVLRIWR